MAEPDRGVGGGKEGRKEKQEKQVADSNRTQFGEKHGNGNTMFH